MNLLLLGALPFQNEYWDSRERTDLLGPGAGHERERHLAQSLPDSRKTSRV